MPVEGVAVIGAGTMGAEIAQVILEHGIPVFIKDVSQDLLDRGMGHLRAGLQRRVDRGRLTQQQAEQALALVRPVLDYSALADTDLVIEAVPELLALKKMVLADLNRVCKPGTIFATNTSSLPISEMGEAGGRPDRTIGFHFFNPATVMKLIEVIVTPNTSGATVEAAMTLAHRIEKLPVRVQECPGFLVNRILFAGMAEGMRYQAETGAAFAPLDDAIRERANLPMGPFALADLVGLDVLLHIGGILVQAYGDRFSTPQYVAELVRDGKLGQKTKSGFYGPDRQPAVDLGNQPVDAGQAADQFIAAGFLEAYRCLEEGIASANDIDDAMKSGAGWRAGPLSWAGQTGLANVVAMLQKLEAQGLHRFAPPPSLVEAATAGKRLA